MKQLLLATAATLALSVPAMAQSQMQQPTTSQQHQTQQRITPAQLSHTQIRQVQQALDKKGFHASRADGRWGPETETALRRFQQQQKLEGNGQLNQQTLAALGVKWQGTTGAGTNETTGARPSGTRGMSSPSSSPGMMNKSPSNTGQSGSGNQ